MSWPPRGFRSGQAVSLLGDSLAVLAIPLLVLGLTRSPLISALSAASQTPGYLAMGLPAGALVDRPDAGGCWSAPTPHAPPPSPGSTCSG